MDKTNKILPIEEHCLYQDEQYRHLFKTLVGKQFRNCTRDGNCLYRTLAILLFPNLKYKDFKRRFFSFKDKFEKAEFSETVYEWYVESLEELIETDKKIEELTEDEELLFIAYLRMICSAEAQTENDKYKNFIEQDIKEYCKSKIDPMEQRAGDFEISILASALDIEITVISVTGQEIQEVKYGESEIKLQILHSPDHFEPLYGQMK